MSRIDNALDFRVVFALYRTRVNFLRLECDKLPWVGSAGATAGLPLQSIVRTQFLPLLNDEKPSPEAISETITIAASGLSEHLRTEFCIFCDARFQFVFEEYDFQAIGRLAELLGIEDGDSVIGKLKASSPLTAVTLKYFEDISRIKAEAITEDNFCILNRELVVHPGKEVCFGLQSKEPLICRQILLLCAGSEVLRSGSPVQFDAGSHREIRLPSISVRNYEKLLSNAGNKLTVQLILEGRKDPVSLSQQLAHQEINLTRPPASVFLDVGSALSKFMVVELAVEPTNTSVEQSHLAGHLRTRLKDASNGSDDGVFLEGPHPTKVFVENYGLSHTPKEILDTYQDEELAAHFSTSISGLADRLYRSEGRLVSDVFWAFPNTKGRDFQKITGRVNEMLAGTILGKSLIVTEADCLRSAFSASLNALAKAAREAVVKKATADEANRKTKQENRHIQKAWNAYQRRSILGRTWAWLTWGLPTDPGHGRQPIAQVPKLEDWHREFSELNCKGDLSDFIVFDAGGYSLDVYATFGQDSGEVLSQSFPAGSTVINNALIDELRKTAPMRSEQDHQERAERVKREICGEPEKSEKHPLYRVCHDTTIQNYARHIDAVLDRVQAIVSHRGFPIILTGGGGRNQFLQQLLLKGLEARSLSTVPITSPMLYHTMRTIRSDSQSLMLFRCMASAFHPEEELPRMAPFTDVLGGLAQLALKQ